MTNRPDFSANAAFGVVLPAWALILYQRDGDKPCDKPIGPWLYTYGMVNLLLGGLGLWINLRMLAIAPLMRHAASLGEGEELDRALAPALASLSAIALVSCCCIGPLGARRHRTRPSWRGPLVRPAR